MRRKKPIDFNVFKLLRLPKLLYPLKTGLPVSLYMHICLYVKHMKLVSEK